jgi:hypothetical protein
MHCPQRFVCAGYPNIARRLDIKIYPASQRATAVNYFTGSGLFVRALRWWAGRPAPAVVHRAQQHLPAATHFHLCDKHFKVRLEAARVSDDGPGGLYGEVSATGVLQFLTPVARSTASA